MSADVPLLESERLILRSHRPGDFAACAAMWADPVTIRHLSGTPSTEQQSWMRLLTFCGLWTMLGFGYWAVEEKNSGAYVGQVGFADFRRELDPSIAGVPEIGWVLASAFSGRGYASEAARAALTWSDANLPTARTVCIIVPANVASLRVAEKCGYREFARTTFLDGPITLFERSRSPERA